MGLWVFCFIYLFNYGFVFVSFNFDSFIDRSISSSTSTGETEFFTQCSQNCILTPLTFHLLKEYFTDEKVKQFNILHLKACCNSL